MAESSDVPRRRYRHDTDVPQKTRKLTGNEIQRIAELSKAGVPAKKISEDIGRTHSTVLTYLKKLRDDGEAGLRPPKAQRITNEEKQRIFQMKNDVMKQKDIATALGRSPSRISTVLKNATQTPPPNTAEPTEPPFVEPTEPQPAELDTQPETDEPTETEKLPNRKFNRSYTSAYSEARSRYKSLQKSRKEGDMRPVTMTEADFVAIFVKGECLTCGRTLKNTPELCFGVDRLYPDLGYVNGNCCSMCWDCNTVKGARDIISFVKQSQDIAHFTASGVFGANADAWPAVTTGTMYEESTAYARQRDRVHDLGIEKYYELCFLQCAYCGRKPAPMHGVDRVDSSIGYTVQNCTTACTCCNMAKKKLCADVYRDISAKISDRAIIIFEHVIALRSEWNIADGQESKMGYRFTGIPGHRALELVDYYMVHGLENRQDDIAKHMGIGNRSSISLLLSKLRLYIQYNPQWFIGTYGSIPTLPKIGPRPLTHHEVSRVIALSREGRTDRYIGKELGRDVEAIGNCINKYRDSGGEGVRDPWPARLTDEEKTEIWNLSKDGMMQKDIAKRLGKSTTCISRMLQQADSRRW